MKITNKHLFKFMEIIGIIGIDTELEGEDEKEFGIRIIQTIIKNANKAQDEIEFLLKDITGEDTSTPTGLIKAVSKIKKDKEVLNFFTQVLDSLK